jgi:hypothetical protein
VAGCCECGDEPSRSCATELVSLSIALCSTWREISALTIISILLELRHIFEYSTPHNLDGVVESIGQLHCEKEF